MELADPAYAGLKSEGSPVRPRSLAPVFFVNLVMTVKLYEKFESWPESVKPPFDDIKVLGYDDEEDEVWYRNHTWQDLKDLILSTERIIEHEIDRFAFGSLDVTAHHYYMKGVLSALAEASTKDGYWFSVSTWKDDLFFYSPAWDWIKDRPENQEKKQVWNEREYTKEEIGNIVELLEQINEVKMNNANVQEVHKKELTDTLVFWKKVYNNFNEN